MTSTPEGLPGGAWIAGAPVGILAIRTSHALIPGNVQHAGSFDLPVLYGCVDVPAGCSLTRGDAALTPLIIDAAHRLVDQGVGAIVGACGSFAHYQRPVSDALAVPAFLSIMVQVPFLLAGLPAGRKLCIIAAWASALTDTLYDQCGITDRDRLVITQMAGQPAFDAMLAPGGRLLVADLRREVLAVARAALAADPTIAAFLLQCSDLPPFAPDLAAATGLPVFDMAGLVRWLQAALLPPARGGFRHSPPEARSCQPN